MKIKKGDTVLVKTGRDKNKIGKIISILKQKKKVVVEGLNIIKKHIKPQKQGQKGQIVEISAAIDVSNIMIICSKCKKATRTKIIISKELDKKKKFQVCKKCEKEI